MEKRPVNDRFPACVSARTWFGRIRRAPAVFGLAMIPSVVVACATVPQAGTAATGTPAASSQASAPSVQTAPPTDPRAYYHFIRGYQAELDQDPQRAIEEYLTAYRGDPSSVFLKSRLASLYFSVGDIPNAVRFADRLSEANIQDAATLNQMATIYAGAGRPDRAIALYDRVIEQTPASPEAYFSKGLLLMNLKRVDEAARSFEAGIAQAKESPIGYYYLGRAEFEAKHVDRAIANFERAITLNPSFEPPYLALAAVYEAQQDRPRAVAIHRKYLQTVNPHSKEVRHRLVRLLISQKAYTDALAEVDILLADDADDLDAQLRAGLIHGELKNYSKAIELLSKILDLRPAEVRVRDYLGLMYEEVKDYDRALQAYEANLKLQPTYYDAHMHMGFLLYRLKRYPEAITHLTEAVKLNPKQPDPHLLLGLTYLQTEQHTLASQAFEEGIVHNPDNPDLHFNLGTAYDKLNRFDDLVRAMETALRLDPHHADALNYLGYTYAERGVRIEEAVLLTQRAVTLKPNNGYYVDSLGWAFYKMGRLEEALTEIKRAAALVKDDPVIYEHLGEIYYKQQHVSEAKEAWLHSLEIDPSNLKLIRRYRDLGLGDPLQEERVRQATQRVSQHQPPQKPATP